MERGARLTIEQYRLALEKNPEAAEACNNLAWALAIAPEAPRDAKAAVSLAEKAVSLAPENAAYANTLGVAHHRAGRYRDAIAILRADLKKAEDRNLAYDLYFLAMSHHRLGETERAKDYFEWAVPWMETQEGAAADSIDELNMLRAEVEELLNQETAAKDRQSETRPESD